MCEDMYKHEGCSLDLQTAQTCIARVKQDMTSLQRVTPWRIISEADMFQLRLQP
jgi:hypothetical protein